MKEEVDLKERTKNFALRIVRMFSSLPKTTEAQVLGKQLQPCHAWFRKDDVVRWQYGVPLVREVEFFA